MHALTNALKIINAFFANIVPIGDILWTFPQNFSWYANIPIIGSIPFCHLPVTWNGNLFFHKNKVCSVPLL